jgi:uncharacterized membrane protein YidH (DUF202 family)
MSAPAAPQTAAELEAAAKLAKAVAANKLKIDDDKLALPLCQLAKWRNISMPGKVFFVLFLVMFVLELAVEGYFIYQNNDTIKANGATAAVWAQYVIGAIAAVIGFCFYMVVIHVMFYSGYRVLAWVILLVPVMYFFSTLVFSKYVKQFLNTTQCASTKAMAQSMLHISPDGLRL